METSLLEKSDERAAELLAVFEEYYPDWRHGQANEHLKWIRNFGRLESEHVIAFFNAWRPLSRHQPQILLLLASAFPDQIDRKFVISGNYLEEDGIQDGHCPHYELLDQLIRE